MSQSLNNTLVYVHFLGRKYYSVKFTSRNVTKLSFCGVKRGNIFFYFTSFMASSWILSSHVTAPN